MKPQPPNFSNVRGGTSSVPSSTPDFSNVQGGTSATQGGGGRGTAGERQYTVKRGDTLSGISREFYGRAGNWNAIFEANRDQLDDPDVIRPGQSLRIPDLDDNDRNGASS